MKRWRCGGVKMYPVGEGGGGDVDDVVAAQRGDDPRPPAYVHVHVHQW